MKRVLSFIIIISLITVLFTGCAGGSNKSGTVNSGNSKQSSSGADNSLESVKKAGKLTIGIDDSFPPMEFRDNQNNLVGYDIDLAMEAAKRLGVKAEWIPTDWNGVVMALNSGKFDIIWSGMSITPERQKEVDFSPAYIYDSQVVVVKAGNNSIKNKEDLKGKVVGLQLGSTSEEAAKTVQGLKDIKKYSKNTEAFLDLANGRLDAVIVDEVVGRYYMTKKPNDFNVVFSLTKEPFGIAYRKKDKALQNALNSVLKKMKEDGTMAKISKRWFGKDISTFGSN